MGINLFTRCIALALVLLSAPLVHGDTLTDPAFNKFRSQVVGNSISYSYGSGGQPLAGGSSATGIGVSGGVDVSRGVAVSTRHGPIVGSLSQKVSAGAMGRAFGRAAAVIAGPVGIAFLALPAIMDWMSDAGLSSNGSGEIVRQVTNQPCRVSFAGQAQFTFEASTCISAAQMVRAARVASGGTNAGVVAFCIATTPQRCGHSWDGALPFVSEYQVTYIGLPVTSTVPATPSEIETALSAVANPSPEVLAELYKLGETINVANPIPDLVDTLRADFDARSPQSTETSTTDSPSQTKTQERTCATYTQVVGSTLSLVENCSTTTTTQAKDPETGAPIGDPVVETTTTGNTTPDPAVRPQEEPRAEAVCGGPGLPACAVKVDETGTPTAEGFGESGALNEALSGREAGLGTARDLAGDTSWGIVPAWTERHACQPWHIFTLPDFVGGSEVNVDLCPLMPVADGIANFIWVMLGIFAVTGMVFRTIGSGSA